MNYLTKSKLKKTISNGGVIAYPTESVYGLGCDPLNFEAVNQICQIKNRPLNKGFILVASSVNQLEGWVKKPNLKVWQQVCKTWPGPYNWILPASSNVPFWITGEHSSIAVRVSQHPIVKEICQLAGHPIISTSVNVSGRPPLKNSLLVHQHFHNQINLIITGKANGQEPCQIIDAVSKQVIRT